MDRTTLRIRELLDSAEYRDAAAKADALKGKVAASNRFQIDASFGEAREFFASLRKAHPGIHDILAIREKEIAEMAIRIKTGKGLVLD